jgi:regulator of sirC expression with transglutaminase-like and TPR domain
VRGLSDLLTGRNPGMALDAAALQLARIEFPGLDPVPSLTILDELAQRLGRRTEGQPGYRYIEEANRLLFDEAGFRGNEEDYYNPRNSCLNDVLSRRAGIPITLSLIYIEVARRLRRTVQGISLPGHFVVRYQEPAFSAFLDPFHGGRLLGATDCFALAGRATGMEVPPDPALLRPASNRDILIRMLHNLRAIYFDRRVWPKLLATLDLLVEALPASAEERKQRAVVHVQLRHYAKARADFERYLELAPEAEDRHQVLEHIRAVSQWMAAMN